MKLNGLIFFTFIFFLACDESDLRSTTQNEETKPFEDEEFVHDYTDYDLGEEVACGRLMQDSNSHETFINFADWNAMIRSADRVVAYNWNGNEGNPANTYHYMIRENRMDKSAKKIKELNATETTKWATLVTDTANYEEMTPMCFTPHIAFLYLKEDVIIGQANICFLCAAIFNQPGVTKSLTPAATEKVKSFCDSLGLTIYDSHSQVSG